MNIEEKYYERINFLINRLSQNSMPFIENKRAALMSKTRHRPVVEARQMIFKILRENTILTFSEIGFLFNKNHATVIFGIKSITNVIETNRDTAYKFRIIELDYKMNYGSEKIESIDIPSTIFDVAGKSNYEVGMMLVGH